MATLGYAKGVPMGGDLTKAPKGKAPTFLVAALKDPDGANLDRVQIIKGWTDPDFDPKLKAFYYARVLEIPTPRWTAYDKVNFNIKMGKEVTRVLQERAYTSPIWYTPK